MFRYRGGSRFREVKGFIYGFIVGSSRVGLRFRNFWVLEGLFFYFVFVLLDMSWCCGIFLWSDLVFKCFGFFVVREGV